MSTSECRNDGRSTAETSASTKFDKQQQGSSSSISLIDGHNDSVKVQDPFYCYELVPAEVLKNMKFVKKSKELKKVEKYSRRYKKKCVSKSQRRQRRLREEAAARKQFDPPQPQPKKKTGYDKRPFKNEKNTIKVPPPVLQPGKKKAAKNAKQKRKNKIRPLHEHQERKRILLEREYAKTKQSHFT